MTEPGQSPHDTSPPDTDRLNEGPDMTPKPRIPMLPTQLPQQRLYLVQGLPMRPGNWSMKTGDYAQRIAPVGDAALCPPHRPGGVGGSPMHMRIDAYYLAMCSHHWHWVLWAKPYDDNWSEWMDQVAIAIAVATRSGLPGEAAARLMFHDHWAQARDGGLDRCH